MCDGTIRNNIISGNSAYNGGGMVSCYGPITNNVIVGNTARNRVGGVSTWNNTQIVNCIIWANDAPEFPQVNTYNLPTYCCIQDWAGGGVGNLAADPRFVDAANGDFHLRPDSPCIDAGGDVPGLTSDFDGNPRPFDAWPASRGDGSGFDIGAYEYPTPITPIWPASWMLY